MTRCSCAYCTASQTSRTKIEPLVDGEAARVAVRVDRLAFDELHREIRHAVARQAAVDEVRDPRMLEQRQDASLFEEAAVHRLTGARLPNQLERHALLELRALALGEVDHAHAAVSQLAHDSEGTRSLRRRGGAGRRVVEQHRRELRRRRLEELARAIVGVEQRRTRSRSAASLAARLARRTASRSLGSRSSAASKISSTCRKRSRDAPSMSGHRLVVQLGVQPAPAPWPNRAAPCGVRRRALLRFPLRSCRRRTGTPRRAPVARRGRAGGRALRPARRRGPRAHRRSDRCSRAAPAFLRRRA